MEGRPYPSGAVRKFVRTRVTRHPLLRDQGCLRRHYTPRPKFNQILTGVVNFVTLDVTYGVFIVKSLRILREESLEK